MGPDQISDLERCHVLGRSGEQVRRSSSLFRELDARHQHARPRALTSYGVGIPLRAQEVMQPSSTHVYDGFACPKPWTRSETSMLLPLLGCSGPPPTFYALCSSIAISASLPLAQSSSESSTQGQQPLNQHRLIVWLSAARTPLVFQITGMQAPVQSSLGSQRLGEQLSHAPEHSILLPLPAMLEGSSVQVAHTGLHHRDGPC